MTTNPCAAREFGREFSDRGMDESRDISGGHQFRQWSFPFKRRPVCRRVPLARSFRATSRSEVTWCR